MKPSSVRASLTHLVARKRPVFVWGPVGAGKSDTVAAVAKDLKLELRDVRLNLIRLALEAVDGVAGVLVFDTQNSTHD